jgi:ribosomal protein S18 acetylase RimI-like enzyme
MAIMLIMPATLDDCRAVAEVHVETWQHAYRDTLPAQYLASLSIAERETMWRAMVQAQPSHLLIARRHGEVAGFVAFGASRDAGVPGDRGEIWALYVRPACWSTGAGRELWLAARRQMLAEGFESVSLWVIADNRRAIDFYERAGFVAELQSRQEFELGGTKLEEIRYVFAMER